ncbi:unnamed protein product [Meloidogyne enterolobii]|uniref:Uncharacterized protein n=1 Tax=Meloidogyne enterolobii TaxID=390850 RepID=A0ACB0YG14_MELEN
MFVNGEGASTRPPLSLPGQEPPIGLCLKEPYLNVLDTAGILFIFSIHDGSLKQSLEFPSDDENKQQQQSLNQKQNLYQLANIDGQTFIIPPFSGCFFELIAMTIYSQIEENILHGYLDIACSMLEEQISVNFENLNELTVKGKGGGGFNPFSNTLGVPTMKSVYHKAVNRFSDPQSSNSLFPCSIN